MYGVVLPWLLAVCFFAGSFLNTLIQWTSALVFVALNLVMPVYMYIITHMRDSKSATAPSPNGGGGGVISFQSYGNTLMSSSVEEQLLGDESINSPQSGGDEPVAIVPDNLVKLFKWPRCACTRTRRKAL